ncbi:hypothetical protein ACFLTC_01830 [Chloroflexota bacterium]
MNVESDVVQIVNRAGPIADIMVFANPLLLGFGDLPLPSSVIAEDFLNHEHDIMISQGVNLGQYELEFVRKGTTTVGEKAFCYMEFSISISRRNLHSRSGSTESYSRSTMFGENPELS